MSPLSFAYVVLLLVVLSLLLASEGSAIGRPAPSTTLPILRRDATSNRIMRSMTQPPTSIEVSDVFTTTSAVHTAPRRGTSTSSSWPIIHVAPTLGAYLGDRPSYEQMRCNYTLYTTNTPPVRVSGSTTSTGSSGGGVDVPHSTPKANACWGIKTSYDAAIEAQLQVTLRQLYNMMLVAAAASSDIDDHHQSQHQSHIQSIWRAHLHAADQSTRRSLEASLAPIVQQRSARPTSSSKDHHHHHCTTPRCLTRIVTSLRRLLSVLITTSSTPHQPEVVSLVEILVDAIQVLQQQPTTATYHQLSAVLPAAVDSSGNSQFIALVPSLAIKVKRSPLLSDDQKRVMVVVMLVPKPTAATLCPTISNAQLSTIIDFHTQTSSTASSEFSSIKAAALMSTTVLQHNGDLDREGDDDDATVVSLSSSFRPLLVPGSQGSRHLICAVSITTPSESTEVGVDDHQSSSSQYDHTTTMPIGEVHVTGVSEVSLLTPTFHDRTSSLNYYSTHSTTTTTTAAPNLLTLPSFPILVLLRGISLPPSYPRIVRALDFSTTTMKKASPQEVAPPTTMDDPSYKILLVRQSYVDGVVTGTQLDPCEMNPYTGRPIVAATSTNTNTAHQDDDGESITTRRGRGPHPDIIPLSVILPHTNAAPKNHNGKGHHQQQGVYDPMPSARTIFPTKATPRGSDDDDEALLMLEHREQRQFAGTFQLWYCGYQRLIRNNTSSSSKGAHPHPPLPTSPGERTLVSQSLGKGARVVVAAPMEIACLQDALLQQSNKPPTTASTPSSTSTKKGSSTSTTAVPFDVSTCKGAGQRAVVRLATSTSAGDAPTTSSSNHHPLPTTTSTTTRSSSSVPHMFLSVSPLFLVDIQRYQQHALRLLITTTTTDNNGGDSSSRYDVVQRVTSFVQEVLAFRRELYDSVGMSEVEVSIPLLGSNHTPHSSILLAFETSKLPNSFEQQLQEDIQFLNNEGNEGRRGPIVPSEQREYIKSKYLALEVKSKAIVGGSGSGGNGGLMLKSSIRYHPLPVSIQRSPESSQSPSRVGKKDTKSSTPDTFLLEVARSLLHTTTQSEVVVDEDGDVVEDLTSSLDNDGNNGGGAVPSPPPLSESVLVVPYKALLRRRSSQLHSISEPIPLGILIVRDAQYALVGVRATCHFEGCQHDDNEESSSPSSSSSPAVADFNLHSSSAPRPQHHSPSSTISSTTVAYNYPHIRLNHPNATSIDQRIPMLFMGVPTPPSSPTENDHAESLMHIDVSFTHPTSSPSLPSHHNPNSPSSPNNNPSTSSSLSTECCRSKASLPTPLLSCRVVSEGGIMADNLEAFQVCPCHSTSLSYVLVVRVQLNTSYQHSHHRLPDGRISAALGDYTIECKKRKTAADAEDTTSSSSVGLSFLLRLWAVEGYTKFIRSYTRYQSSYAHSSPKCRSLLPRLPPIDRLTSNTTTSLTALMQLYLTVPTSIILPIHLSSKSTTTTGDRLVCSGGGDGKVLANLLPFPSAVDVGDATTSLPPPAVLIGSPSSSVVGSTSSRVLSTDYSIMGILYTEYTHHYHPLLIPKQDSEDGNGAGGVLLVTMVLPPALMWAYSQPKEGDGVLTSSISIDTCLGGGESTYSCICVVNGALEEESISPSDDKSVNWRRNVRFPVSLSSFVWGNNAIPFVTTHVWLQNDPATIVSSPVPMPLLQSTATSGGDKGNTRLFHGPLLMRDISPPADISASLSSSSSEAFVVEDAIVMISSASSPRTQQPPQAATPAVVGRVTAAAGSKWLVRIRFPVRDIPTTTSHLHKILSLCTISEDERQRRETARLLADASTTTHHADPLHGLEPFVPGDVAEAVKNTPIPTTSTTNFPCKVQFQQTAYFNRSTSATVITQPRRSGTPLPHRRRPLSSSSRLECTHVKEEGVSAFLDCQSETITMTSDPKLERYEPHIAEVFLGVKHSSKKHVFRFSARHAVVVRSQRRQGSREDDSETALLNGYLLHAEATLSSSSLSSHSSSSHTSDNTAAKRSSSSQPQPNTVNVVIDNLPVVYADSISSVVLPTPPPPGFEIRTIFGEFNKGGDMDNTNDKKVGTGGGSWRQLAGDLSSPDVSPSHMLFLAPHALSSTHRSPSSSSGGSSSSLRLLHRPHASTQRKILNATTAITTTSAPNDSGDADSNLNAVTTTKVTTSVVVRNESQTHLVAIPHWWLYTKGDTLVKGRSTQSNSVGSSRVSSFEELTAVLERSSLCALLDNDDLTALDRLLAFDSEVSDQQQQYHTDHRLEVHRRDALRAAGVLPDIRPSANNIPPHVRSTPPPSKRARHPNYLSHRHPFYLAERIPKGTAEEMARVGAASKGGGSGTNGRVMISSHNMGVDPTPASHLVELKDRLGVWVIPTTTTSSSTHPPKPSLSGQFTACLFKRTITINTTVSTTTNNTHNAASMVTVSQSVDVGYVVQEAGRSAVPGARDTTPLSTLLPPLSGEDSNDEDGRVVDGSPQPSSSSTTSSSTTTTSSSAPVHDPAPTPTRSHPTTHIHTRPCDLITLSIIIPPGTVGDYIHRGLTFIQLQTDEALSSSYQPSLQDLSAHDFVGSAGSNEKKRMSSSSGSGASVVRVLRRNVDYITLNPLTYEEAMMSIPLPPTSAPTSTTYDNSNEYVQATLGVATVQVKFFVTGRFAVAFRREVLNASTTTATTGSGGGGGGIATSYASDILVRHTSSSTSSSRRFAPNTIQTQTPSQHGEEGWLSISDLHLIHGIEYSSAISASYHRSLTSGSVMATPSKGRGGGGIASTKTHLDEVADRVQTDLQERKSRIKAMLEQQNNGGEGSGNELSGLAWLLRTLRRPPPIPNPTRTTAALPSSAMSGGPTLNHEGVQLPATVVSFSHHDGDGDGSSSGSWRALFPTKGLHGSPPPTLADLRSVTVVHVAATGSKSTLSTINDDDADDVSEYEGMMDVGNGRGLSGTPPSGVGGGPQVHPPKVLPDSVHIRWADDDANNKKTKTRLIKVSVDVCASLPSVETSRRWLLSHTPSSPPTTSSSPSSSSLRYFGMDSALSATSSPWYDSLPDSAASALVWSNSSNNGARRMGMGRGDYGISPLPSPPMWQSTSPSNLLERCVLPGAHVVRPPPPPQSSSKKVRRQQQPSTTASAVPVQLGRWLLKGGSVGGGARQGTTSTLGVGVVVSKRRYPVSFHKLASLLPVDAYSSPTSSNSMPITGRVVGVTDSGVEVENGGGMGLRLDGSVLIKEDSNINGNYREGEGESSEKERSTTDKAEDRLRHLATTNPHRSPHDTILHTCLVGHDDDDTPTSTASSSTTSSVLTSLSKIARLTEFNSLMDGSTDSATAAIVDIHTLVFTVRVDAAGADDVRVGEEDDDGVEESPIDALVRTVNRKKSKNDHHASTTSLSPQGGSVSLSVVGGVLNTTIAMSALSPKALLQTILASKSPHKQRYHSQSQFSPHRRRDRRAGANQRRDEESGGGDVDTDDVEGCIWAASVPVIGRIRLP